MMKKIYNIIKDEQYGYYRLDPLPDYKELDVFYRSEYYDFYYPGRSSLTKAPDVGRRIKTPRELIAGWHRAQKELVYLNRYSSNVGAFKEHGNRFKCFLM